MATATLTDTGGLGDIVLELVPGRESVTAASRLCVLGIAANAHLLSGTGIDWGSGSGCLAIAAARIATVERVVGLELVPDEVAAANRNASANGVAHKVTVVEADSYEPVHGAGERLVASLCGATDFIVANPPASSGDDGLSWRRRVLAGAGRFLTDGAPLLMQVSYQYGDRIAALGDDAPDFSYEGAAFTTDLVPFDLERDDLAAILADYIAEEARGGLPYAFEDESGVALTATEAGERHRSTGRSPLSRWQMHLFRFGRAHPSSGPTA